MAARQTIRTIEANDLTFAYYESGSGPLILCLHGFPDTADTWSALMERLAASGYRAIAPFMRGYPPTSIPTHQQFSVRDLAQDVLALIDSFGERQAGIIGHNWGALAGFAAANLDPDKIRALVAVGLPHAAVLKQRGGFLRKKNFLNFRGRNNPNWIRHNLAELYRRWSPNWQLTAGALHPVEQAFAQPGCAEAASAYFQVMERERKQADFQRLIEAWVDVDTLAIFGDADGTLDLTAVEETPEAFTGFYEYKLFPGVGHFPHREAADTFNRDVLAFLQGRIPPATRPMR